MQLVDTNIILRYLLEDDVKFTHKADNILEKKEVTVLTEVLCEVVYVSQKVYGIKRKEIVAILLNLLSYPNISTVDSHALICKALELYQLKNIDFVDALLCSHYIVKGATVYTFDKKINKFITMKKNNKK